MNLRKSRQSRKAARRKAAGTGPSDPDRERAADLIARIAAVPGDEDAPDPRERPDAGVAAPGADPSVPAPSRGVPPSGGGTAPDGAEEHGAAPAPAGPGGGGERRRLVRRLGGALGRGATAGARGAGRGARAAGRSTRSLADRLIEAAPRIPVRRLATLQEQRPGAGTEELADRLVRGAERATAGVGAGIGAAAMLPNPLTMPVELTAETLAVAAIEVKLVAELHEVYGAPAPGTARQRGLAYLSAWAHRRGLDAAKPAALAEAVSSTAKRDLRNRLVGRTVRNAPKVTPFLIGAGVGAALNHRDTRRLAERVRDDLRRRAAQEVAADPGPRALGPDAGGA